MDFTSTPDKALLAELEPLRASSPALQEYIQRQEVRFAHVRELTKSVLQLIGQPKVAVVDLEATCYESAQESADHAKEVIEVGWALLEPSTGAVLETKQFYVKPTTSFVSAFCTRLTGITPEQVANAASFADVMAQVGELHRSHGIKLWTSYGAYDRSQLERQCEAEGVDYPWAGQQHINIKGVAGGFFGYGRRCPGLAKALALAGLELEGRHHSGVDDARNTARLIAAMLGRG